ncbi:MAG: hypothetical protein ND895_01955 [Pyrinomonadaceae bacterium]|nr:hypothetical protein [Pyrinomonadaceae bacterium]
MPAERAKARFQEFLATAVAEHKFSSASLSIQDVSGQVVPRYERLIGMPAQNNCFFARLTLEQSDRCIDELIKDEASAPGAAGHFALAQMFQITKWRVEGQEVPTSSSVTIHYGQLPCISTFFQFETVEQFHSVRRVLEDIGLCKLNEKHLKPVRPKKK